MIGRDNGVAKLYEAYLPNQYQMKEKQFTQRHASKHRNSCAQGLKQKNRIKQNDIMRNNNFLYAAYTTLEVRAKRKKKRISKSISFMFDIFFGKRSGEAGGCISVQEEYDQYRNHLSYKNCKTCFILSVEILCCYNLHKYMHLENTRSTKFNSVLH